MGLFDVCENMFKIASSPESNCKSLGMPRARNKWYINHEDIDKTGTQFNDNDDMVLIEELVLYNGAKIYPIPGAINQLMFSDELSIGDYTTQAIHQDQFLLRNPTLTRNVGFVQALLSGTRIATINELMNGVFVFLGYDNGLVLTEGGLNPPENDGGRLITLRSPEGEPESTVIKRLFIKNTHLDTIKWLQSHSSVRTIAHYSYYNCKAKDTITFDPTENDENAKNCDVELDDGTTTVSPNFSLTQNGNKFTFIHYSGNIGETLMFNYELVNRSDRSLASDHGRISIYIEDPQSVRIARPDTYTCKRGGTITFDPTINDKIESTDSVNITLKLHCFYNFESTLEQSGNVLTFSHNANDEGEIYYFAYRINNDSNIAYVYIKII